MTPANLDSFESALLAELRAHVVARSIDQPARRPVGRRLAALAAAAAVAAVAAATGLAGLRPDPAFAVERQGDGDIVVTILHLSDTAGLEHALAKNGVTAQVTYESTAEKPSDLAAGGTSTGCPPVGAVVIEPADDGGVTFTLDSRYVVAHDNVLHLTVAGGRTADDWVGVRVQWEGTHC
jgi:hypothetical protein